MKVVYKTITTAESSIVVPVTTTVTLALTSTKVVQITSPVTIEKLNTATETIIEPTTIVNEKTEAVTYTVVETKVVPTTAVEVVTTVVPTGQLLALKLTSNPLMLFIRKLYTKQSQLPEVQLLFL